jgi:AraC-like DNA-binding protein
MKTAARRKAGGGAQAMADYAYMPSLNFFVHRICTPNWVIVRQMIDFNDLTYVYAGRGCYIVDGQPIDVYPGCLLNIPCGHWREAYTDAKDPLRLYALNYNMYDYQRNHIAPDLPLCADIGINKELLYSYATLARVWALKEPTYLLMGSSTFLSILSTIIMLMNKEKTAYRDARVQKVADYVLTHLNRPVLTRELQELVELHPVYLNTLVQKHTGYSLRNFINLIKINVAEDMIHHENISVHEAALRCGFGDIYYFSRIFKKIKGYPPSYVKKTNA